MSQPSPLHILSSSSGSRTPRNGVSNAITPDEYGTAIAEFSKLRTGEGEMYEGLADFLNSEPFSVTIRDLTGRPPDDANEQPFLTVYELCGDQSADSAAPAALAKPQHFQTPDEFYNLIPTPDHKAEPHILFFRGAPSPRWLKVIGSRYKLEPDFLAKHLDFLNSDTSEDLPVVGLPTSQAHVIQLCITTLGSRDCEKRVYAQDEIDNMRKQDQTDMTLYHSDLLKGKFRAGSAIVRHYSTLDETFFAIEQRVTIHIQNQGQNWTAFVWLDSGNGLEYSAKGPWSRNLSQTRLHPVVVYLPMDALNPMTLETSKARSRHFSDRVNQPQTAALLPFGYGSKLRPEELDRGVMYVLYEIFSMSAHSESRFLARVDLTLRKTLGHVNEERFDGFTDLTFFRRLLYRHIQHIQTAIIALKSFQSLDQSEDQGSKDRKPSKAEAKIDTTTMWILQDFNHNLQYANALDKQCQDGITVLMSSASIAESRKAMVQQERIAKLTLLAFLFVPLSFTTSFFGMNVKELSAQVISIWAWFIMAVFVVSVTQIAYFCTLAQLTAPFRWRRGPS